MVKLAAKPALKVKLVMLAPGGHLEIVQDGTCSIARPSVAEGIHQIQRVLTAVLTA